MADQFVGKAFKSDTAENMDAYFKAQKVGYILRKAASNIAITEKFTKEGDTYTLHLLSTFKNAKMSFKLGEEFVDTGVDGRTMKTTFYEEDGKLVGNQEPTKEGDVACRFERELVDNGRMKLTCTSLPDNTQCVRYFNPVDVK